MQSELKNTSLRSSFVTSLCQAMLVFCDYNLCDYSNCNKNDMTIAERRPAHQVFSICIGNVIAPVIKQVASQCHSTIPKP